MADIKSKLQIKEGMSGRVVGKPRGLDLGVRSSSTGGDFIVVFVKDSADLDLKVGDAIDGLIEDGVLWFCYPKRSSGVPTDISRDSGWEPVLSRGFRGVRQIAIDDTWSALRFRRHHLVKSVRR